VSAQQSTLTPAERLRAFVQSAFPDRKEIASVSLGNTAHEAWKQLSIAAGVNERTLARAIAKVLGLEPAESLANSDPFVTRVLPEAFALQQLVFPVREHNGRLVIAAAFPFVGGGLWRAEFLADRKLEVLVATPDDVEIAISRAYSRAAENRAGTLGTISLTESGDPTSASGSDFSAVVQLSRALLVKAIEERASDLHIQPFAGGGMVRIRVDGLLRRIAFISGPVREALVRYTKAQGGMDPTNNRIAQDGRMSLILGGNDYELRLSVLPANRGETLVIRILDQSRVHHLRNSGFSVAALQKLRQLAGNTSGVILVTGPTGSGKSSTLYGMLNEINRVGVNMVTVENPVEYRVPGISQVEVNVKAGLTFSSALRSILRQDPDVILVGEIRDAETAEIAMQAALTGHLVLSTLHTNDALTAIPRLTDLGVQPSVLADAVIGVVAQRLFRRLCARCREPVGEPLQPDEKFFCDVVGERPAYRAMGCTACGGSGYFGRFPVAEVVEMTPELGTAIAGGEHDLAKLRAFNQGPVSSMSGTAAARVISGDTTAREVTRVIGQRFWTDVSRIFARPIAAGAVANITGSVNENAGIGVLIFSMDAETAKGWAHAFEGGEFVAHVASDPDDARRALEKHGDIMLLVVDLEAGTPDENVELLKRLRIAMAWTRLPAIVIVPRDDSRLQAILEEHDVSDYLRKPLDGAAIASRARAVLAR
jgi:type IV pilus assembly protein PilB